MTIEAREYTGGDFDQALFEFIRDREGAHDPFSTIGADPVGVPTLAYGYALFIDQGGNNYAARPIEQIRSHLESVGIGVGYTEAQWAEMESALASYLGHFNDQRAAGLSGAALQAAMNTYIQGHSSYQDGGVFDFILTQQQNVELTMELIDVSKNAVISMVGSSFSGNFTSSNELIALTSLHFNVEENIGPRLRAALNNEDPMVGRVLAWMEIRYRSNGNRADSEIAIGIQNRRNLESSQFGLFDSPTGLVDGYATVEEQVSAAREVLDIVQRNLPTVFSANDPVGNGIDYVTDILDATRSARLLLFTEVVSPFLPSSIADQVNADNVDEYVHLVMLGNSDVNLLTERYAANMDDGSEYVFENDLVIAENNVNIASGSGNDIIVGDAGSRNLFGGDGNDILITGSGARAFGEAGNDTLVGGVGDNLLLGGTGFDTYVYDSSSAIAGFDTIVDEDGQGRVLYNGVELSTAEYVSPGFWQDANGNTFQFNGNGLLINGTLLIQGYDRTTGSLGITLSGDEPEPVRNIIHGTDGDDMNEGATMSAFSAAATSTSSGGALVGDAADDEIYGYGGNDDIYGGGGADILDGGDGDDILFTSEGNDVLLGGQGNDILLSSDGNDNLSGGTEIDFLQGGNDADLIDGGAGDDILNGGAGEDRLEGGDGADILLGDATWEALGRDYQFQIVNGQFVTSNVAGGYDPAVGDADYIHGGSGNDNISGGGGDDYIVAGPDTAVGFTDDDHASGDAGNDRIYGGAGNDTLSGDNNNDLSIVGHDFIDGGSGNDLIDGGTGDDVLFGGAGDDILYGDGLEEALNAGSDVIDGGDGNDSLLGGYGDDLLIGGAGDDQIAGGEGADEIRGDDGNDIIEGGGGDDMIHTGNGLNNVTAGDGNDVVTGGDERDVVSGGAGIDELYGHGGDDELQGDSGNDRLFGGSGNDRLFGQADNDQLYGDSGDDEIYGGDGIDDVSGGTGNDQIFGNEGDDALSGDAGADWIQGDAGNDGISGGADDDVLFGGLGADNLFGDDGNDQLQGGDDADILDGGSGDDTVYGDAGNDIVAGGAGNDEVWGDEGNDELRGGTGDDELLGGAGDDTYVFNLGDGYDRIIEQSDTLNDQVVLGSGINPADISFARRGSSLVLLIGGGTDQLELFNWYGTGGQQHIAQVNFSDGTSWDRTYLSSIQVTHFIGTNADDYISSNHTNDTLEGYAGNDTLSSGGGNDVLIGGTGNDSLNGSTGTDRFLFTAGDGHDTILNAGSYSSAIGNNVIQFDDTVTSGDLAYLRVGDDLLITYAADSSITVQNWFNGQNRIDFEFADGSIAPSAGEINDISQNIDHDYGFAAGDGELVISDWGGSDSLTFAAGIQPADITSSREGLDLVLALNGTDRVVIQNWFDGSHRQLENVGFTDSAETLDLATLTASLLTIEGTSEGDYLQGSNAYDETLLGYDGNDSLDGYGGNDTLDGGSGNDYLRGGAGDDVLRGGVGDDRLYGGEGNDTYLVEVGDGIERISDGAGFADVIRLGVGLNLADATFSNAVYETVITFTSGQEVRFESGIERVEFQTFGTEQNDILTGGDTLLAVDVMHGLGGDDVINSGGGADTLYGGDGNDILDSGAGGDWLYGGAGNDTLGGEYLSDDYYGETNFYTGGAGDDTLNGSYRNDVYHYNLGDGHDRIIEREWTDVGNNVRYSGSDYLRFGPGISPEDVSFERVNSDMVIHVGETGSITVQDWFATTRRAIDIFQFTMPDGSLQTVWDRNDATQMALIVHGTDSDEEIYGTAFNDTLFGHGGNDSLWGESGNDILDGGAGDDWLYGDAGIGNDTYRFDRGYGRDVVVDYGGVDSIEFAEGITAADIEVDRDGNNIVLRVSDTGDELLIHDAIINTERHIENIVFADGSTLPAMAELRDQAITISGTAGDDVIDGTGGIDIIRGEAGNDVLLGHDGNDALYGGDGDDVLNGALGNDILAGGLGNDIYVINTSVDDFVSDRVNDLDGISTLRFSGSESLVDIGLTVTWRGDAGDLAVNGIAPGYRVIVEEGLTAADLRFEFADGTILTFDELAQAIEANGGTIRHTGDNATSMFAGTDYADTLDGSSSYGDVLYGHGGNDLIYGYGGADSLYGENGNDTLTGGFGNDLLFGGDGDDNLIGSSEHDLLDGGAGNDVLDGGTGNDVYAFNRGYGHDVIVNETPNTGPVTIRFGAGVTAQDVVISDDRKNRVYTIAETGDTLTLTDFTSKGNQLSVILEFEDGTMMTANADGDLVPMQVSSSRIEPLSSDADLDRRMQLLVQAEGAFGRDNGMAQSFGQRDEFDEQTRWVVTPPREAAILYDAK